MSLMLFEKLILLRQLENANHRQQNLSTQMKNKDKKEILIKKASGETELFSISKLKASLQRAGADNETTNEISADIESWVYTTLAL